MQLQKDISKVHPEDFPRVLEVWEASVRATHHFLSEADIQFFKPLIPDAISQMAELACVRDSTGKPFPLLHMRLIDLAGGAQFRSPSGDRRKH